jgi:hypothetical protein
VDLDGSGHINANDLQTALNLHAAGNFDFDENGVTNGADLTLYQQVFETFFGQTCP